MVEGHVILDSDPAIKLVHRSRRHVERPKAEPVTLLSTLCAGQKLDISAMAALLDNEHLQTRVVRNRSGMSRI